MDRKIICTVSLLLVSTMLLCCIPSVDAEDGSESDPYVIPMVVGQRFLYYPTIPETFTEGIGFDISGTATQFITMKTMNNASSIQVSGTAQDKGVFDLRIHVEHLETEQEAEQWIRFNVIDQPQLSFTQSHDLNLRAGGSDESLSYTYVTNDITPPEMEVKKDGHTVNVEWIINDTANRTVTIRPSSVNQNDYGSYEVILKLTDTVAQQVIQTSFAVTVSDFVITAPDRNSFDEGEAVSWTLSSNRMVNSWDVDLGASGFTYDELTGTVYGVTKTADTDMTYTIRVTAHSGSDSVSYSWTFDVSHYELIVGQSSGWIWKGDSYNAVILHTDTIGAAYTVWDMGDGKKVTQDGDTDITYTYADAGTYLITQTSYDADGNKYASETYTYKVSSNGMTPIKPPVDKGTVGSEQQLQISTIAGVLCAISGFTGVAVYMTRFRNPIVLVISAGMIVAGIVLGLM